ncbi:unnamed protein product [Cyclocybe aegerita]|uniref:C2H2-type domain-containing protein n=1 Tax=Cyclocybe aegerita TaxID=1973307 RepID=A0A8S0W7A4_CYCAE|nr:unnamed protein product [Cyclocybe aegerita]
MAHQHGSRLLPLILLFVIAFLIVMHSCIPGCPKSFTTTVKQGLTHHQKTCEHYQKSLMKAVNERKLVGAKNKVKVAQLKEWKERIHVTAEQNQPGSSSLSHSSMQTSQEIGDMMDIDTESIHEPTTNALSISGEAQEPMNIDISPPIVPPQSGATQISTTAAGCPRRNYRMPARYRDMLPEPAPL